MPGQISRERAELSPEDSEFLQVLLAQWQLLADLSFADLVLWLPTGTPVQEFRASAQIRPLTAPTAYVDDAIGTRVRMADRESFRSAWQQQRIHRESDPSWRSGIPVREEVIPIRRGRRLIALLGRETNLVAVRTPSRLELAYLQAATELVQMLTEGRWPSTAELSVEDVGMRVGDGFVRLDAHGQVVYASPNAQSAYRRLGYFGDLTGQDFRRITAVVTAGGRTGDPAGAGETGTIGEIESGSGIVQVRSIALAPGGHSTGSIVLVRDLTELRTLGRALLTKDATIREIHHRVKNNLQTVAALLRLQARRLDSPEAIEALQESVRRVSAIAVVHETLSRSVEESAPFDQIADRVLSMVGEMMSGGPRITVTRLGSFGILDAQTATPLSMVLAELVQNAIEHGFTGRTEGTIVVEAIRAPDRLSFAVRDDGIGVAPDFALDRQDHLGLQIVRELVESELRGTITVSAGPADTAGGTVVTVTVPLR